MIDWNIVGIGITFIIALATFGRWMFTQFNVIKDLVFKQTDKILDKLEYHERHDDARFQDVGERFNDLRNNLWEMKVAAAQNVANQKAINNAKS